MRIIVTSKDIKCRDCQRVYPEFFMVKDDLWATLATDVKDILCIHCLNNRALTVLGRGLQVQDFKLDAPVNELFFFGCALGTKLNNNTTK